MYKGVLEKIGLTNDEAEIYEILLKKGNISAASILKEASLKKGLLYKVLNDLVKKELVIKNDNLGSVQKFSPQNPQKLLEIANTKKEEVLIATQSVEHQMGNMLSDYNLISGDPFTKIFQGDKAAEEFFDDALYARGSISSYVDDEFIKKHVKKEFDNFYSETRRLGITNEIIKTDGLLMNIYNDKISFLTYENETLTCIIVENRYINRLQKRMFLTAVGKEVVLDGITKEKDESLDNKNKTLKKRTKITFGVSPFQDNLVPIVGKEFDWYKERGIDVDFKIIEYSEVPNLLDKGEIDVSIASIGMAMAGHAINPEIIYWYGVNVFNSGFDIMIRGDGEIKPYSEIHKEVKDKNKAITKTASQLKNKTIVTVDIPDEDHYLVNALKKANLSLDDVTVIYKPHDEAIRDFLSGTGDAFIGGIPQRSLARKSGMVDMFANINIAPSPLLGFVTRKTFASKNQEAMYYLLDVWFKIVNLMNTDMKKGSASIISALNKHSNPHFNFEDFKNFWNRYELYPENPAKVSKLILDPTSQYYWKTDYDSLANYFVNDKKILTKQPKDTDVCWLEEVHSGYIDK
ncbi:ABC transporter substrate-binding protein [Candidatus Pacebacteria bacterium]|nr:ABC transporter substrate-binding protein [Candidatus Paceibacterota bacterium]